MPARGLASALWLLAVFLGPVCGRPEFSDQLVIEVNGGEDIARKISRDYGLDFVSRVFPDEDFYLLARRQETSRPRRSVGLCCTQLREDSRVKWVEQQAYHTREKRIIPQFGPFLVRGDERQGRRRGVARASLHRHRPHYFPLSSHGMSPNRTSHTGRGLTFRGHTEVMVTRAEWERHAGSPSAEAGREENRQQSPPWSESLGPPARDARGILHDKAAEVPQVRLADNSLYERYAPDISKKSYSGRDDMDFNDPYYPDQWYLNNYGQMGTAPGHDINVLPAWKDGYTGRGVVVSVLDDGIQHTNQDIHENYEPSVSYDLVSAHGDPDPMPNLESDSDYHGTFCAAVIAAVANNSVCGVGVAYKAKVGGVRLLPDEGRVRDVDEAAALSHAVDRVDVYSASWGPTDDGRHVAGPGRLAAKAIQKGIEQGRNGKGVIYIWAVGNGGTRGDNCNLDGYTSSVFTLSVSALTYSGLTPYYVEPCAATLASTYIGGPHTTPTGEREAERERRKIKVVVPELDGGCRESFQGTSAAAPMAAGIVALVLQANPSLTWRDIQHIVVATTRRPGTEAGWRTNGAGHQYHLFQGFGAMDAAAMVQAAETWRNVPAMRNATVHGREMPVSLLTRQNTSIPVHVHWYLMQEPGERVASIEYVITTVSISHRRRGQLELFIISPAGTESQVLTRRQNDRGDGGFSHWDFVSAHFWGEDPSGVWTLIIRDHSGIGGSLDSLHFTFTGT